MIRSLLDNIWIDRGKWLSDIDRHAVTVTLTEYSPFESSPQTDSTAILETALPNLRGGAPTKRLANVSDGMQVTTQKPPAQDRTPSSKKQEQYEPALPSFVLTLNSKNWSKIENLETAAKNVLVDFNNTAAVAHAEEYSRMVRMEEVELSDDRHACIGCTTMQKNPTHCNLDKVKKTACHACIRSGWPCGRMELNGNDLDLWICASASETA